MNLFSEHEHWGRLLGIVLLLVVFSVITFRVLPGDSMHDFQVYYYSGEALDKNLNPYNLEKYDFIPTTEAPHVFTYLPLLLWVFYPLHYLPYATAATLYIGLKLLVFLGLIWLWEREFLDRSLGLIFVLFALFAFNNPLTVDLSTGNFSLFLQVLTWLGLWGFLNRRYYLFAGCVLLASTVTFTPLFFLLLFFLDDELSSTVWFSASLGGFGLFIGINYLLYPGYFEHFLKRGFQSVMEYGVDNPALLPFMTDLVISLRSSFNLPIPIFTDLVLYGWAATTILIVSWPVFEGSFHDLPHGKKVLRICGFCLLYGLLTPRMKDYHYILLLFPAYYVIMESMVHVYSRRVLVLTLLFLSSSSLDITPFTKLDPLFNSYRSLTAVFICWAMFVITGHQKPGPDSPDKDRTEGQVRTPTAQGGNIN